MVATSTTGSPETVLRSSTDQPRLTDPNTRLKQLERELQRLARRKLKGHELTSLRHAALASLRYECAAFSGKAESDDIVRLGRFMQRARQEFATLVGIELKHQQTPRARSVDEEIAAHVAARA